jgi:DNA-directed RNA polymerase subunit L
MNVSIETKFGRMEVELISKEDVTLLNELTRVLTEEPKPIERVKREYHHAFPKKHKSYPKILKSWNDDDKGILLKYRNDLKMTKKFLPHRTMASIYMMRRKIGITEKRFN